MGLKPPKIASFFNPLAEASGYGLSESLFAKKGFTFAKGETFTHFQH
jgi:hypothetical protein